MSRKDRKNAMQVIAAVAAQAAETPTTDQPVAPEAAPVRSLGLARVTNAANPAVDPASPARAVLVRPAKGENPKRQRVFGYDNGEGGKVPVNAKIVVVNAGNLKSSYPSLAEALETTPEGTVATLKTAGVPGKSFRRAFRSGLIRFAQ